jgi:hypothetical protein
MGYLEGLSKSIDAAVPLALKLHEMRRNEALAAQKMQLDREQWAQAFKETQKKNAVYAQSEKIKAGLPLTDTDTQSAFGTNLPREAVFVREMEAPSAEALRAQLAGPDYKPLENLQITPSNPVPGRGFQAEDFEGATRFDVSGQQVVQPVSVDLQKKAQDLEQRRLEEDARDRRAIEANETRIKAAEIAQRWRLDKEPEKWSDPYQMVIGGKTVLVRKNLATNETVKISEDSPKVDNKPEDKERKVIEAQNATDELLVGRNKRVPIEKERLKWLNSVRRAAGLPPMIEKFVDNWGPLNEYTYEPAVSGVGPRAQQAGGSSPKPSNVIRYDAKGNRL